MEIPDGGALLEKRDEGGKVKKDFCCAREPRRPVIGCGGSPAAGCVMGPPHDDLVPSPHHTV